MEPRKYVWTLILLATAATMSWAQADAGQTTDSQVPGPIPSASDNESQAKTADDLPGVDQGQTPQQPERRSFFLAGLHVSENAESTPGGALGSSSQISSITNAFGSLHLLSLQRHSETAIDYLGGAQFSRNSSFLGSTSAQAQQLNAEQSFLWRRAELIFADEFGNLPGGDFGSSWFGGAGLYNLGIAGVSANLPAPPSLSNFFASSGLGGFEGSNVTNISFVEYREVLTRRSSMTVIGGYGITDYSGSQGFINSQVIGTQASYNYQLNRRDNIGFSYGFRSFRFPEPGEGNIDTNSVELIYGHRVSTRISFTLGIGPEFVKVNNPPSGSTKQINVSGDASVSYFLRKATLTLGCEKQVTSGAGLFAGANSDTCQLSVLRSARKWSISLDTGYARLSPIGQISVGNPTQGYEYAFVGAAINRDLARHFGAFVSYQYQFDDQSFHNSVCTLSGSCNQITGHILSVGIDLRTRPRRLE